MKATELDQGSLLLGRMALVMAEAGGLMRAVNTLPETDVLARVEALHFAFQDVMGLLKEAGRWMREVLETATREHVEALLGRMEEKLGDE